MSTFTGAVVPLQAVISLQEQAPLARVVDIGRIQEIHRRISANPLEVYDTTIRKTPGLISKELRMNAGSEYLSKVHNSEHQFVISYGSALVSENDGPPVLMVAPYHGITKPGTWRHMFMPMMCVWTTFHATDKQTIEELEKEIIQPVEVPS